MHVLSHVAKCHIEVNATLILDSRANSGFLCEVRSDVCSVHLPWGTSWGVSSRVCTHYPDYLLGACIVQLGMAQRPYPSKFFSNSCAMDQPSMRDCKAER